jgi:hypothetical protein
MSFDFETFETSADDVDSPISTLPQLPPPPLRIHHFFRCGIVTAIYLTWWRQMMPPPIMQQLPPVAVGFSLIYNVLTSISFTFAAISLYWYFKGYADLSQPGVWLLLSYLVFVLPLTLNNLLVKLTGFNWSGALKGYEGAIIYGLATAWYTTLYILLPLAFFAYGAWAVADTRPWRWVFIAIAILHVLPVVQAADRLLIGFNVPIEIAHGALTFITAGVVLSAESWAAKTDLAFQRARYWPHWAGLWLAIAKQSFNVVAAVVTLLGWF